MFEEANLAGTYGGAGHQNASLKGKLLALE